VNQLTVERAESQLVPEPPAMGIVDVLEIVQRRWLAMVAAAAVVFAIALVIAMALPATYRSTATILVEEQSIPRDFIRSTITSFADERISVISQRVLTRTTLLQLVEKYDLYPDDRKRDTNDAILERMRKDVRFTPINADLDSRGGRILIAFQIAYVSESPAKAQRVVNELVSLFLNENVRVRQQRTAETSAFLAEESKRLSLQLQEMETKLAQFRARNQGTLPEASGVNFQLAERIEGDLMRADRDIRLLQERRDQLQQQLPLVNPFLPLSQSAIERNALDPAERLRLLRAQQTSLGSTYSPEHPDMRRMSREIAALTKEVESQAASGGGATAAASTGDAVADAARKELEGLRAKLLEARERYAEGHPDVQRLQKQIAALEKTVPPISAPATQQAGGAGSSRAQQRQPDNPNYIALANQLSQTILALRELTLERDQLRVQRKVYASRMERTPVVTTEYQELARDYDNASAKYRDIKGKELEAKVAEELEKDRKGERFSLLEPAGFPEKPFDPDRKKIALIGLALAIGLGLGFAALREALDFSIKGARDLSRRVALPVLTMVPYLESSRDVARRVRQRIVAAVGTVAVLVVGLLVVNFFVTPLSVLFFSIV
jgi:polysaccharide biosynthesis transport protein